MACLRSPTATRSLSVGLADEGLVDHRIVEREGFDGRGEQGQGVVDRPGFAGDTTLQAEEASLHVEPSHGAGGFELRSEASGEIDLPAIQGRHYQGDPPQQRAQHGQRSTVAVAHEGQQELHDALAVTSRPGHVGLGHGGREVRLERVRLLQTLPGGGQMTSGGVAVPS